MMAEWSLATQYVTLSVPCMAVLLWMCTHTTTTLTDVSSVVVWYYNLLRALLCCHGHPRPWTLWHVLQAVSTPGLDAINAVQHAVQEQQAGASTTTATPHTMQIAFC
jgi:hypothetical protein